MWICFAVLLLSNKNLYNPYSVFNKFVVLMSLNESDFTVTLSYLVADVVEDCWREN